MVFIKYLPTMADISPLSATELFPKVSTSYRYSQRRSLHGAPYSTALQAVGAPHGAPGCWFSPWCPSRRSRLFVLHSMAFQAVGAPHGALHGAPCTCRWLASSAISFTACSRLLPSGNSHLDLSPWLALPPSLCTMHSYCLSLALRHTA